MLLHVLNVLPGFLAACAILAVLPGPATALFLHRTVRDGRAAGLAAVAGNELGLLLWLLAGGAGLSALLAANHVLFDAMHVIGAILLISLGVGAWRSTYHGEGAGDGDGHGDGDATVASSLTARLRGVRSPRSAFQASLLSIASNPKAAVFAISFLPQFLPRHGPLLPTVMVLATVQVTLDTLYCAAIVLLADRARRVLAGARIRRRIERTFGLVLVALGCEFALETANPLETANR